MKACHLCLLACLAAALLGGTTAQLDGLLGAVGGAVGGALSDRECGAFVGGVRKAWGLSGRGKVWAVGATRQFQVLQALRSAPSLLDTVYPREPRSARQGDRLQGARRAPPSPLRPLAARSHYTYLPPPSCQCSGAPAEVRPVPAGQQGEQAIAVRSCAAENLHPNLGAW